MSTGKSIDDDDDEELELEPIDPEVLAHERQRASAHTERVIKNVDVDELYGDEPGRYSDLTVDFSAWRNFRFTTRHLLIVTALLALGLTLFQLFPGGLALFLIAMVTLAAGHFFVSREENRKEAERQRRREAFYAEQRAEAQGVTFEGEVEEPVEPPQPRPQFKFAFSLRQLLITMTAAAVIVGLIRILGGAGLLAVILGSIALVGLILHARGYDPPPSVVLAWWLLLLAYLVVGVIAALTPDVSAGPISVTYVHNAPIGGRAA